MKVLVACEFSGKVRDAFTKKGHFAFSCDLLPSLTPGYHHQGDVFDLLDEDWDMVIAFPPCTHLSSSGAKHFEAKRKDGRQQEAIDFFHKIANWPCERIAIENPIGVMSTEWRKPDQIIQPWQFGHEASKSTCLWLKGLPLLKPTNIVSKGSFTITKGGKKLPTWYNLPPSPDRAMKRSITFQGIADAMADQWG
jgi:site-specific DNA-cytosine methylase